MVPDIEDAMNEDDAQNTILVTQLLDNSAFLVDTPRGEKKLPTEGNDGRYHIEGTPISAKTLYKKTVQENVADDRLTNRIFPGPTQ
jgi:hypothetical protein